MFSLLQRGSDELLSQAAVMAPASDNNNQDLATKKAKLDSTSTVLGGVGKALLPQHFSSSSSLELRRAQLSVALETITNSD